MLACLKNNMSNESKNINNLKSWAEDDRPREKFMMKGKNALSDAELLAIIMGSGNKEETAVDLAKRILNDSKNNWHELARLSVHDLIKYKGIGEAKAISIITALEIGVRKAHQAALEKPVINSSKIAYELLRGKLGDLNQEEFHIILLNRANKLITIEKTSEGGISQTVVDQRVIFRKALNVNASAIILAHNHPSGNLNPSQADIEITKKIEKSGNLIGIELLDHIIVSATAYYSFKDEGIL